jgi:DNA polymerase-3 subunit alpha
MQEHLIVFTEMHRGQYYHIPQGDTTSNLEKIIRYGQQIAGNSNTFANSLFGEDAMPEIQKPKMVVCEPAIFI